MVGKIESSGLPYQSPDLFLYEVVQVRQNAIISYTANAEYSRIGNTETLKQSLRTPVDEVLEELYNESGKVDFDKWISEYLFYYEWKKKYIPFALKELGTVSRNTRKRICKLIENAVNAVYTGYDWKKSYKDQPYISFLTTTLPAKQMHSDKILKRAFTVFLENLVKTYGVKFYLWKAEAQSNGNIHFHVLIDRYVDHQTVRRLWNSQMKSLGYIDEYAKSMNERGFVYNSNSKKSREMQHLDYLTHKNAGFNNPNSTDIHSLKGIDDVGAYMVKYMTKEEEGKRPIIGRVWGCSRNIKFLKYAEFVGANITRQIVEFAEKHAKRIDGIDFVLMYKGNMRMLLKRYLRPVFDRLKAHYMDIHKQLYDEPQTDNLQGNNGATGLLEVHCAKNIDGYQATI